MKTLAFLLLLIPVLFVPPGEMQVRSSKVGFRIKNAGISVDGTFSGLEAKINFDPLKPESSSIKATVLSNSINTGNNTRDGHLRKPLYFDTAKYPKISLESEKIEKTGPISFTGTFRLTIKNISKQVKIPFLFMKVGGKTEFKGSFTINRLDYNVGESSFTLSDNVTIDLLAEISE